MSGRADKRTTRPQTTIFGVTYAAPIFLAPVSVQGLMHKDGELATARATAKVGVPMIVSSFASRSMEEIAKVQGPNGHRWFQLNWQIYFTLPIARETDPGRTVGRILWR